MTQSVIPGGVVGPTGLTGPQGPAGPTGASVAGSTLASAANIGDTSITLSSALAASTSQGFVAIEPYTANCEIRRLSTVSGATITLGSSFGAVGLEKTHTSGTTVVHFTEDSVSAAWFGCRGDAGSLDVGTDDSIPLQWALDQTAKQGLWLHGQNRSYSTSVPMVLGSSGKLRHLNLRPKATYAPIDPTNAMLMHMQGGPKSFTSAASTDQITAPGHNLPGTDSIVMFKGAAVTGGLVAGRIYYVRDITATTFKVASTLGGAAINLTADGSGTVYTEVSTLGQIYINDVFMSGRSFIGLNGAAFNLQQPSFIHKLRTDNFNSGTGLTLTGQQAVFENFEAIGCGTALAFENASYMWFYDTNFEQFVDRGLHVRETAQIFSFGGSCSTCLFHGLHIEMLGGSASRVAVDMEGGGQNLDFTNVNLSMANIAGQRAFWVHQGDPNSSSYSIRGAQVSGLSGVAGVLAVQDDDRGFQLDWWTDLHMQLAELVMPIAPSSQLFGDPGSMIVPRVGGGWLRYGGQLNASPSWQCQPATNQTGEQSLWRDKTGAAASWVNKDGYVMTAKHAAPADADLAAGQVAFWFDQTDGAGKLMVKAKTANGTVRTGSVTLS